MGLRGRLSGGALTRRRGEKAVEQATPITREAIDRAILADASEGGEPRVRDRDQLHGGPIKDKPLAGPIADQEPTVREPYERRRRAAQESPGR